MAYPEKLYRKLAQSLAARENCAKSGNVEWFDRHAETIQQLIENHMPSGSGFDNGPGFDWEASNPNKLVFHTSFHHMDDDGMYDGWTDHTVTIVPSLAYGFEIRVSGRDRNKIKDYIAECFNSALEQMIDHDGRLVSVESFAA